MATEALGRRLDNLLENHANGEPYTGAMRTFRCGHPKSEENTARYPSRPGVGICRECARMRARVWYADHHEPALCGSCDEPLGSNGHSAGYHSGSCEPTTCTCGDRATPDGLGECGRCRRLVLSHSWHTGRP